MQPIENQLQNHQNDIQNVENGDYDDESVEEEDEEEECFFESLDRIPSRVSFCLDIPSSSSSDDDNDGEDDDTATARMSFVSAIAPPSEFRSLTFSRNARERLARDFGDDDEEEVIVNTCTENINEDRGSTVEDRYGVWIAEPLSIEERRRKLLQGMGIASSDDLGSAEETPQQLTVTPSPQVLEIKRSSSDTKLLLPRPKLLSSNSLPLVSGQRKQCGGELIGDDEGREEVCRIKNLDTGKEFVVSEVSKDGNWGKLNDVQTGVQITMEEFEKCIGHSPLVTELLRRANLDSANGKVEGYSSTKQISTKANQVLRNKSTKAAGYRKKGGWLKNIKYVASPVTWLIAEKGNGEAKMGTKSARASSSELMKVRQHGKSFKELSGLYMSQEIKAHEGSIWTMKFSSDARYLASGGEDRIVHVWQVQECDAITSLLQPLGPCSASSNAIQPVPNDSPEKASPATGLPPKKMKRGKSKKSSIPDYIVMPEVIFSLSDKPVCSFKGHLDDVLDISWSKAQHLLSSSMDKTVRLWDLETKSCLKIFAHNDYVTCIQFNPIDDRYFISGSLDAKVRLWSIPARQVVDWNDLNEMVTAACYTPDGQGAFVGSHKGSCRMYNTTDSKLTQECQIDIRYKKKKSYAKKVTGFQFASDNPSEVMITSAGSQIRVFHGVQMVQKFRGFRNTNSQISASYTADGKYVVCASEDSNVYVWKRDLPHNSTGKIKGWSTTRAYEHFYSKDVSVAIPWPSSGSNCPPLTMPVTSRRYSNAQDTVGNDSQRSNITMDDIHHSEKSSGSPLPPLPPNPKKISEQRAPSAENLLSIANSGANSGSESFTSASSSMSSSAALPPISEYSAFSSLTPWGWGQKSNDADPTNAWGLVIVTASLGGDIRIYQNFGMPVRLSRQTNIF